jgi:anti-anti-sigma factor
MTFSYHEEFGFLILTIDGEVRVHNILDLKKELQTLINEKSNIAIDLSKVPCVDSSGLSLFVNMHKRLVSQNRLFCMFNYAGEVAKLFYEANLAETLKLYPTKQEFIHGNVKSVVDDPYPPAGYAFGEKLCLLKNLKCVLCDSEEIKGYILNLRTQDLHFEESSIIPTCVGREGHNTLDLYSMEITICPSCFFASRHINHFTDLGGEFTSLLTDKEIHTLVKEDGNRMRMLSGAGMSSMDKFYPPFSPRETFWVYTMAEECAHTLNRLENRLATYDLARYNIALTLYCQPNDQSKYLRKAYMWYGEIFKNKKQYAPTTFLEACYYLSVISGQLKRSRDNEIYFAELKNLDPLLPNLKKYLKAATHFLVAK